MLDFPCVHCVWEIGLNIARELSGEPMRLMNLCGVLAVSGMASACAIHPLPEDFSRSTTFDIVQKIRCEARDAVGDVALTPKGKLSYSSAWGPSNHSPLTVGVTRAWLSPGLQYAAIGYTFRFTITEGDNGSASGLFQFPFSNGTFSLGVSAGEDKKRKNDRSFDLVEDFAQLLADRTLVCGPEGKNWKYPITGEIGLREVIETYVRLSGLNIFTKPSSSSGSGGGGSSGGTTKVRDIYEFTDDLTFTTTYNASVSPAVTLKPVPHDFRLVSASGTFGGIRQDIHNVTLALKAKPAPTPGSANLRGFSLDGTPAGSADTKSSVLRTLQNRRDLKVLRDQIFDEQ
jgi:hypothetical protein